MPQMEPADWGPRLKVVGGGGPKVKEVIQAFTCQPHTPQLALGQGLSKQKEAGLIWA